MAIAPKKPIPLPKSEQQQVLGLAEAVAPTVVEVLRTAVEFISHGQTVTLIPDNQANTARRTTTSQTVIN
jgi:hypothetical protein